PLITNLRNRALHDLWRIQHPHTRAFTFERTNTASRIDYILGTDSVLANCLGSAIGLDSLDTGSDHNPVFAEIGGVGITMQLPRNRRDIRQVLDVRSTQKEDWSLFRER